jgi:hypothetical protein
MQPDCVGLFLSFWIMWTYDNVNLILDPWCFSLRNVFAYQCVIEVQLIIFVKIASFIIFEKPLKQRFELHLKLYTNLKLNLQIQFIKKNTAWSPSCPAKSTTFRYKHSVHGYAIRPERFPRTRIYVYFAFLS